MSKVLEGVEFFRQMHPKLGCIEVATGNTFRWKDHLKDRQFRWSGNDKFWYRPEAMPIDKLRSVKGKPMWEHQLEILKTIRDKRWMFINTGLGSGKTRPIIEYHNALNLLPKGQGHVLVICPNSIINSVWVQQLAEWSTTDIDQWMPLNVDLGSIAERADAVYKIMKNTKAKAHFMIAPYESFWQQPLLKELVEANFNLVCFDESHYMKNPRSVRFRSAWRIANGAKHRVCQTATPVTNSPMDIWAQSKLVNPSIFLGNAAKFREEYARLGWDGFSYIFDTDKIAARLAPNMYRIDTSHLLKDVPPARDVFLPIEVSKLEQADYTGIREMHLLTEYLRKHQLSGKLKDRREQFKILLKNLDNQKAVVYYRYTDTTLPVIKSVCEEVGLEYAERRGGVDELVDWIHDGKKKLLLCQYQSGSVGENFQDTCSIVIYYELDWRWDNYEQSKGRVYRPGQRKPCVYYHLVANTLIDSEILDALNKKQNFAEEIANGDSDRKNEG